MSMSSEAIEARRHELSEAVNSIESRFLTVKGQIERLSVDADSAARALETFRQIDSAIAQAGVLLDSLLTQLPKEKH